MITANHEEIVVGETVTPCVGLDRRRHYTLGMCATCQTPTLGLGICRARQAALRGRVEPRGDRLCRVCGEWFPLSEFSEDKNELLTHTCLACAAKRDGVDRLAAVRAGQKTCSVCGKAKDRGEFNVRLASPDGRQPICRTCQSKGKTWKSKTEGEDLERAAK